MYGDRCSDRPTWPTAKKFSFSKTWAYLIQQPNSLGWMPNSGIHNYQGVPVLWSIRMDQNKGPTMCCRAPVLNWGRPFKRTNLIFDYFTFQSVSTSNFARPTNRKRETLLLKEWFVNKINIPFRIENVNGGHLKESHVCRAFFLASSL